MRAGSDLSLHSASRILRDNSELLVRRPRLASLILRRLHFITLMG